uniref:Uncharacterized protein n=1 Tax=Labrus bergylta TaxID=56723 RepID=A0A3Q3EUU1_9LABR
MQQTQVSKLAQLTSERCRGQSLSQKIRQLAPAHHSREKSQRSFTTHRFTHATHTLLINTLLCTPPGTTE